MKYKVVEVTLLVPNGDDSYYDLLSDYRDDYPDQLVEFTCHVAREGMTAAEAEDEWQHRCDEVIHLPGGSL